MTIGKCIKKAIVTFALTTILLKLFLKNIIININFLYKKLKYSNTFSKLLINHQQKRPHQQLPKKVQSHLQLPKTPNHQLAFFFKITHTRLKNDTHDYLNR